MQIQYKPKRNLLETILQVEILQGLGLTLRRLFSKPVTRQYPHEKPKILTGEAVEASDVVITMGCGDACPFYPGKTYLDWKLDDPAGQGVDSVRPIRDDIRCRITELLTELGVEVHPTPAEVA